MHVQIVLFDGFDLLDAIAPYEVFSAAAMYSHKKITVELVSAEGTRAVTSGVNGLKLQTGGKLDVSQKGIILVPGAAGTVDDGPDSIPKKLKQATETELRNLLIDAMENPHILLSTVCGGSLLLAMSGLLEDRHAVTHPMGMDLLGATQAVPVHARIVDDGDLVTGGGVTSGLDVALYLVERELGPRIAHAVEQLFDYERRGTVWKNTGDSPIDMKTFQAAELESGNPITSSNAQANVEGKWEAVISTPIDKLSVLLEFTYRDGEIIGTATQGEETIPLDHLIQDGNQVKWSMKVTKPVRLSLKFTVTIDENTMYGEAKAGILPASPLTGRRIQGAFVK